MKYEGALYRPPSEAASFLIQATIGCSWNKCTYCAMYRDRKFRIRPLEELVEDVREGARVKFKRVFICDGDALIAPTDYLLELFNIISTEIPSVERIGIYGDCRSILNKSLEELRQLRRAGLGIVYHGIETGDDQILVRVNKGSTAAETIEAGRRVRAAGIKYSAIVMLGLGGRERWYEHITKTAEVLNAIQPDFVGALVTMVMEDTPLEQEVLEGKFRLPSRFGIIRELKTLLENLDLRDCLFTSKHSSNYVAVRAILPDEKHQAVEHLNQVLESRNRELLRPDFLRRL